MATPLNILVEVSPLNGSTPVTLRLASLDADLVALEANGQSWLPCINQLPKTSVSFSKDGILGDMEISRGEVGYVISRDFGNSAWTNYKWNGAFCQIWVGEKGKPFSAYRKFFQGKVSSLDRVGIEAKFSLLGPEADLTSSILTLEYAGTGGREGPSSLKGQAKPRCYGSPRSVEPVEIDPVYLVYQVHGYGAVQSITPYEFGAPLLASQNKGNVATYTALCNMTLNPGEYATCLAEGMFRFGGTPTPKVSADVVMASGNALSDIAEAVLLDASVPVGDIGDFSAFDSVQTNLYITEESDFLEVFFGLFKEAGGYAFADANGVWQCGKFYQSTKTPVALKSDRSAFPVLLQWKQEAAQAPLWRVKYGFDKCWGVHADSDASPLINELAGDLTAAKDAADAALDTANAAASDAALAYDAFNTFVSDGILDSSEKKRIVAEIAEYAAEKPGIEAQADQFSITTEKTAFQNAYTALTSYLNGLSPAYTNYSVATPVNRTTFLSKLTDYTSARQDLLNKIASLARIKWNGAWNATTTYSLNDGVTHLGRSFISRTNGNINHSPPTTATNNTYWSIVADRGAEGAPAVKFLTTTNVTLEGSKATKTGGGTNWNAGVYSQEAFNGGAYASAKLVQANSMLMVGLSTNRNTSTTNNFTAIDYALYADSSSQNYQVYRNGIYINPLPVTPQAGDILAVRYDGNLVSYCVNGTEYLTHSASTGESLYFCASIRSLNSAIDSMTFGPMASKSGLEVSPSSFGAKYAPTVDDTAALLAAIEHANGMGGYVLIPAGKTLYTSGISLPAKAIIRGSDRFTSKIKLKSDAAFDTRLLDGRAALTGKSYELSNLTLDASQSDTLYHSVALEIHAAQVALRDLEVTGGAIEGIYLYQCSNFQVSEVHSYGNGGYRVDASGLHLDTCDNFIVSNLNSHDNGFHGLILTGAVNGSVKGVMRNNGFDGVRAQYGCTNVDLDIVSSNNFRGIYFTTGCSDCTVRGKLMNNGNGILTNDATGITCYANAGGNAESDVYTVQPTDTLTWLGSPSSPVVNADNQGKVINRVVRISDTGRLLGAASMFTAAQVGIKSTTSVAMSAVDAGSSTSVNVAAHNRTVPELTGARTITYNSGSVVGLGYSKLYYIYCDDPDLEGGLVTYHATEDPIDLSVAARAYVGTITTPAAGGTETDGGFGGSGGGGGGGGGAYQNKFVQY
ncbi:right-handed parallel beta-helix repeat-containing protein [Qipengyuania sp. NPDC077410]|uniref:right-handed parallel beta-helix repeat-containing protein n=1 Tax=Qipengyuania sp. NPDC077410 TaxID=3364496 RepID=UPI0037C7D3AA